MARCVYGQALAEFKRLIYIETDDCVLWPYAKSTKGYGKIKVNYQYLATHRLALIARVGDPPSLDHQAAHGPCHQPSCINYRHLSWKTAAENQADKVRDDTHHQGERNPYAKLTNEQAATIYRDTRKLREIAAEFGVSTATVSKIRNGHIWVHPIRELVES